MPRFEDHPLAVDRATMLNGLHTILPDVNFNEVKSVKFEFGSVVIERFRRPFEVRPTDEFTYEAMTEPEWRPVVGKPMPVFLEEKVREIYEEDVYG